MGGPQRRRLRMPQLRPDRGAAGLRYARRAQGVPAQPGQQNGRDHSDILPCSYSSGRYLHAVPHPGHRPADRADRRRDRGGVAQRPHRTGRPEGQVQPLLESGGLAPILGQGDRALGPVGHQGRASKLRGAEEAGALPLSSMAGLRHEERPGRVRLVHDGRVQGPHRHVDGSRPRPVRRGVRADR